MYETAHDEIQARIETLRKAAENHRRNAAQLRDEVAMQDEAAVGCDRLASEYAEISSK